jgi:hypothetical protein
MADRIPKNLIDLFAIADREITAELFKIAAPVAAGATATTIATTAPPWLRTAFPSISANFAADLDRFAILLTWAMYCQNVCTTRELARKWRIAKTLGTSDDDCLDFALAAGAELAEQRFTAWALDLPVGAAANSTDRFMSALAERIARRVASRLLTSDPPLESDF